MRSLDFADGFQSLTEPLLGTISANNLYRFASDVLFVAYKGSPAAAGDLYFNTTLNHVRWFDGTGWVSGLFQDELGNVVIAGDLTILGTTTTINTENLVVTDKNITVNKNGNDLTAQGAGLTVERDGAAGSLVYDSTKNSRWKAGDVGAESEVVTASHEQTLTNKTLTAPLINNPTGITKANVGLANVDNTSDATKNSAAANLSNKTFTNKTVFNAEIVGASSADATAGENATALAPTTLVRFLTGAITNLIGIEHVAGVQPVILVNTTGADITVSNLNAAAAENQRIVTGLDADMKFRAGASLWLVYDLAASKWRVVGGTGGGGSGFNKIVTKTASGPVAADEDCILIDASAGSVTLTLSAVEIRRPHTFFRLDDVQTNTVTIQRAGADQILGELGLVDSCTLPYQGIPLKLVGITATKWGKF